MTAGPVRAADSRRVLIPPRIAMRPRHGGAVVLRRLAGETMGTTWSAQFVAPAVQTVAPLRQLIVQELEKICAEMSPWRANSDISRFNNAAAGTWQILPRAFFSVLSNAHAIAAATEGAYDPTAGRLVNLWGFGPPRADELLPSRDAVASAQALCGYGKIALRAETRAAYQSGGLILDLSSIAKGFAVDRISDLLRHSGIDDHLVEVGGELRGSGMKADGSPWWVEIETPGIGRETIVALHGLAIATSGEAQRYFDRNGKRYSHTLDPRRGVPIDNGMISVTVLHESCEQADAIATALTVLGPDEGARWAEARGVAALLIFSSHNVVRETLTPRLRALLD